MKPLINKLVLLLPCLLLYAAWPVSPFTFLIFGAFVPLFWIEANTKDTSRFFWILWLNLLAWNLATTWWIWNASPGGAVGAIVANSLLMCFPWMLYRFTKNKLGEPVALAAFVAYWITWEYIHHNWDLSWPWLTLGNVFSTHPNWVQWYELTGTTGGSLWVLLVNILIFTSIRKGIVMNHAVSSAGFNIKSFIPAAIALILPMVVSVLFPGKEEALENNKKVYGAFHVVGVFQIIAGWWGHQPVQSATIIAGWWGHQPAQSAVGGVPTAHELQVKRQFGMHPNVVAVQPNVEPYTEKFNTDPGILIDKMISLSESQMDAATRLVIWPETAIPVQIWENEISTNGYYSKVFNFVKKHPGIQLITGIDSYKDLGKNNPGGFSIRTLNNGDHYEAFNTAFATDSSGQFQLYHKSKLVPGVETLPAWLGFMSSIFDDLGGTTGSLGKNDTAVVFSFNNNPYKTAPVICYESIYSNYVTEYVKKGANLITIITNDGWWGETPGYKQHMNMARLRAIENRRWVARSANTGISCFIDPLGNVINPQPWDKAAAIKMNIPPLTSMTFYTTYGDWLSRFIWPLALLVFLFSCIKAFRKKNLLFIPPN